MRATASTTFAIVSAFDTSSAHCLRLGLRNQAALPGRSWDSRQIRQ